MSGFTPSALRVNDKVGICHGGMNDQLHIFGTVTKVIKTQLTVTDYKGRHRRFRRKDGYAVGCSNVGYAWNPPRVVSRAEAEQHNKKLRPQLVKKRDHAKLVHATRISNPEELHQRQITGALAMLNERYAGDVPPPIHYQTPEGDEFQERERVLVKIKGQSGLWFAQYIDVLDQWQVEGLCGDALEVIEWWPLPGGEP